MKEVMNEGLKAMVRQAFQEIREALLAQDARAYDLRVRSKAAELAVQIAENDGLGDRSVLGVASHIEHYLRTGETQ